MVSGYPDLVFLDLNEGKEYHYHPKEDITPYEVSLLITLFACGLMNNNFGYYNFWGYIEKHNLMRHFEEMEWKLILN